MMLSHIFLEPRIQRTNASAASVRALLNVSHGGVKSDIDHTTTYISPWYADIDHLLYQDRGFVLVSLRGHGMRFGW